MSVAMEPGVVASEVARAAGIYPSQLFRWRRQLCERMQIPAVFTPVTVAAEPEAVSATAPEKSSVVEIEFAGDGHRLVILSSPMSIDDSLPTDLASAHALIIAQR